MNYPVWPDSGVAYPRTLLNNGGMRSLPPPPPPTSHPGGEDSKNCPPKYGSSLTDHRSAGTSSRISEECGSRGQLGVPTTTSSEKYPSLSSFPDDDSLLKVATHFLSGSTQGRHYVPIARDYSSLAYAAPSATYCPQQAPISLERPSSRNPQSISSSSSAAGQDGAPSSRIPSTSSSDNGAGAANAGNNPLLSPCSAMEEASSPASTTSQLSYLGALQSPAATLTPLGFPNPYMLGKDPGGVMKKKENKAGSDVRSFGCQVCGRGFKQKATLAQHERTHTDERPFDCPDCHKRFRQQSHLVQHLRIHSDERPYSCSYCDKSFRQKAILNQHVRIHTGEKPYVCPQCTKCFRQKAILNQHIRTHSGKRPFSCPDAKCKKKFVDQASMEKHFKKHIEEDQQQLLAEARGALGDPGLRGMGRSTTKGLLRVKLSSSDRPAAFSRVVAPGAGGITTQDRATSPFPISMMVRNSSPDRVTETPSRNSMEVNNGPSPQPTPSYLHHGHHAHQPQPAPGPYQFVPFPHRPYPYDLLSLGPMGQGMYTNKAVEQAKYRDENQGHQGHLVEMDNNAAKDCTSASLVNYQGNGATNGVAKADLVQ